MNSDNTKYTHIVTADEVGLTINQILRQNFHFSSRFRTKMKYQSLVDLNRIPSPGYLRPEEGDIISIRIPEETSDFPPEDIPLDIIYEDDDLIVINKQPGIIVHPTKGHPTHTIANAVMKYMIDTDQSFKIRFANRIDMDTTGIIIVAKNSNSQNELSNQMRRNTVVKKYKALGKGHVEEEHFIIEFPIGRPTAECIRRTVMTEHGKNAISEVRVLARYDSDDFGKHTLVEVTLHTGRTHQIRVHLSHIGHIIAGDELYGGRLDLIGRQALHAYHIEFDHPINGKHLELDAELPDDIRNAINKLNKVKLQGK